MRHEVTAVFGDSPPTFRRVQQVLATLGAPIDWDEPSETASHADMLRSARRTGVALVGHQAPTGDELPPAVVLRDELGVFAQHRPIRPLPGLPARHDDANLLVVRETTEDVYAHLQPLNEFITICAFCLFAWQIFFVVNFFGSLAWGKRVGRNPWQASTLEWEAPSPPAHGNFDRRLEVERGPYEYGTPEVAEDYLPQAQGA